LLYNTDCDIVFVTETWLHSDIPNGLLEPHAQYTTVCTDHDSCKGGGVCAFVNKRHHVVPVTIDVKFCNVEIVCFDWVVPVNCIRFFVIYRPPSHDHIAADHLLIECLTSYEHSTYTNIIVGDFNLPKINWNTLTSPDVKIHRPFLLFTIESSYRQFVDFPTNDNNVLDLILFTDANIISHVSPDLPLESAIMQLYILKLLLLSTLSVMLMVSVHIIGHWLITRPSNCIYLASTGTVWLSRALLLQCFGILLCLFYTQLLNCMYLNVQSVDLLVTVNLS